MRVVLVGKGQMLCALIEGCRACRGVEIAEFSAMKTLLCPNGV